MIQIGHAVTKAGGLESTSGQSLRIWLYGSALGQAGRLSDVHTIAMKDRPNR